MQGMLKRYRDRGQPPADGGEGVLDGRRYRAVCERAVCAGMAAGRLGLAAIEPASGEWRSSSGQSLF